MPNTIQKGSDSIKAINNQTGDTSGCWHLRAVKNSRNDEYFCLDCYLRGSIYIENGKRMFKRWYEVCD